jgi:hypothetical protein
MTGTTTNDRKIIPPIQLTAARMWSQVSRIVIRYS